MSLTVTGQLVVIKNIQQVSAKFTKREFVVEVSDNPKYPQMVLFELSGDRVNLIDGYQVGEQVEIEFNLRGREWKSPAGELKYFNTLSVWKLKREGQRAQSRRDDPPPPYDDDIPF